MKATEVILKLYNNKFTSHLFHTSVYSLKRELKDCNSVLDLGCGPDSPSKNCNARYSVGVDVFGPYVKASKDKRIHDEYIISDIRHLNFKPNSFDAVFLIEVLEHLTKKDGEMLLQKAETWARKKVIFSSPNGYFPQFDINGNPFSRHLSGWEVKEIRGRG
jgi:2-polyprenyl-3-methyl-5-hydroxy-6-metoxy-1,4-benzoquinol methylase